MSASDGSLQNYSDMCWRLAAQCKTRRAGRVMRMLAADLRLAAEKIRAAERRAVAGKLPVSGNAAMAGHPVPTEAGRAPAVGVPPKPETPTTGSASTA